MPIISRMRSSPSTRHESMPGIHSVSPPKLRTTFHTSSAGRSMSISFVALLMAEQPFTPTVAILATLLQTPGRTGLRGPCASWSRFVISESCLSGVPDAWDPQSFDDVLGGRHCVKKRALPVTERSAMRRFRASPGARRGNWPFDQDEILRHTRSGREGSREMRTAFEGTRVRVGAVIAIASVIAAIVSATPASAGTGAHLTIGPTSHNYGSVVAG